MKSRGVNNKGIDQGMEGAAAARGARGAAPGSGAELSPRGGTGCPRLCPHCPGAGCRYWSRKDTGPDGAAFSPDQCES